MIKTAVITISLLSSILFLITTPAWSAPVITSTSGTFSHQQTINIQGSGFGSKAVAKPLKYDDFENGTVGQSVATSGYWQTDGTPPKYSNLNQRGVSSKNVRADLAVSTIDGNLQDTFYKTGLDFSSGKVFVNFWLRFNKGTGDDYYQVKTWRIQDGGSTSVYPSIACFPHPGDSSWFYYQLTREGAASAKSFTFPAFPDDSWVNITAQIATGTPYNADGEIKIWHDGKLVLNASDINIYAGYNQFTSVKFGEYIGNGGIQTTNYFDNVYVDNSWARVEIGNSPIYANCTHKEIQIPNTWSPSSVNFTVNQGSFSSGETAYLFLIDENGVVNQEGIKVVFDSAIIDDNTPPEVQLNAASNLRVASN